MRLLLLAALCAAAGAAPRRPRAQTILTHDDPAVGTYVSSGRDRGASPARGPPGTPPGAAHRTCFVRQRVYLERVRAIVQGMHPTLPMPVGALGRMMTAVVDADPGYESEGFLRLGLPAVWARIARTPSAPVAHPGDAALE